MAALDGAYTAASISASGALALRDSAALTASRSPGASGRLSADPPAADPLQTGASTASFYDLPAAPTAMLEPPKVSLWDLRNELKAALAAAGSGGGVTLRADAVQRMLLVMRDSAQHNRVQRALRKEARGAAARVEALQKEHVRLQGALRVAEAAARTAPSPTDSVDAPHRATQSGCKTPPPFWPAAGVLPFASSGGGGGPGTAALRSGGASSSVDGRSHKSDGLAGDEVEALSGGKGDRSSLKQALQTLAEERRKTQRLEARVAELEAATALPSSKGAAALWSRTTADGGGGADGEAADGDGARSSWGFFQGLLSRDAAAAAAAADGGGKSGRARRAALAPPPDEGTTVSEAEIMADLASTKIGLAEAQGQLTAARRDLARVREELAGAQADGGALREERDKAWEEVGSLMVQLHVLQGRNDALVAALGGPEAAAEAAGDVGSSRSGGGGSGGSPVSAEGSVEAAATLDGAVAAAGVAVV